VFWLIPIDKPHMLHQQLAKVLMFATVGHTMAHYVNYSLQPDHTLDRFGAWPFYSGINP
jgi:hypothetical protein